ncbi:MAG: imidazole glycerol phosphate synthase, glutamine amidotransferase subunit [Lentisphaerae bacterium GWF2_44_16]|nr:MAG: imidazole glycerol phosphate synthase, glutamine amidotransferase subunit [Lentisphaerae bacterium GWF2_44_16]
MIALIDYGIGNLLSVSKALEAVGAQVRIVEKGAELEKADAVVLPGVGNFGDGMENLCSRGFADALLSFISTGRPYLGICLGMQLLMEASEEAPGVKGLGIFKGKVLRFPDRGLKVPHMGWNNVKIRMEHVNTKNLSDNSYFYFVHSYYVKPDDPEVTAASSEYILEFASAIARRNIFAVQFHPEKSQNNGLLILKNFVKSAEVSK